MKQVSDRTKLADWMIENGLATGHGDSIDDLLRELSWQIKELRRRELHWSVQELDARATKLRAELLKS
jgi:hypothetical protein